MSGGESTVTRESPAPARPLYASDVHLPDHIRSYLLRAETHWLKNTEVLAILQEYDKHGLAISCEPPFRPPGGSIFLFDRKAVRFFRKDGHNWRKKADGKTVRETHEKLKVGNVEMLNCYYAHSERDDGPQRRCYWQLESKDDIVLVHYLVVDRTRASSGEQLSSLPYDSARASHRGTGSAAPPTEPRDQGMADLQDMDAADNRAAQVFGLPTMSVESFLAEIDEQDPAQQRLSSGIGDDYADSFLPSWDELAPYSGLQGEAPLPGGKEWMGGAFEQQELGALPSQIVQAGGAVRLIESADTSFQGGMPQDWGEPGVNVLGMRQMSHDARQTLRQGPLSRTGQRSSWQEPMYAKKQEHFQRAADVQTVSLRLQGAASSIAGVPGMQLDASQDSSLPVISLTQEAQRSPDSGSFTGNAHYSFHAEPRTDPLGPFTQAVQLPASATGFPNEPQGRLAPSPFGVPSQDALPARSADRVGSEASAQRHGDSPAVGRLAARSTSMELPTMSRTHSRGVAWKDLANGGDDFGGAKARGRAYAAKQALAMESELSRIVQHLNQPSDNLSFEVAGQKVRAVDSHLQRLESNSTQLRRSRSGATPFFPDDLFADGAEASEGQDNTSNSVLCTRSEDVMGDAGSAPPPFEILDYTPDWDFTTGGSKLIVTCSFADRASDVDGANVRLYVMFDKEQVLATVIRPGVIKVFVPPHDAGTVDLRLSFGDGRPRSCSCPFTYRVTPQSVRGASNTLIHLPDREIQHRLIHMLTGASGQPSSDQDSAGCSSGTPGMHRSGAGQVCRNHDGHLPDTLRALPAKQGEQLLTSLIEAGVQRFASEAVGRELELGLPVAGKKFSSSLCALHPSGSALIHLLAGLGYERSLDSLLAAGADPSTKDAWGYTPLHYAAAKGRANAVALLLVRQACTDAETFLSEAQPRHTPADCAALAGHAGIAAFLGDTQLSRGVLQLAGASPAGEGPETGLQRKRSRHLPQGLEKDAAASLMDTGSCDDPMGAKTAAGKENAAEPVTVIRRAKQNAETLETAILRKLARKATRQEKKLHAQKLHAEALDRLQQYAGQWNFLNKVVPGGGPQEQEMHACLAGIGARIGNIQQNLEAVIRSHAEAGEKHRQAQTVSSAVVADYGSDSDVTMSRCKSHSSMRRLKHMHDSRRADGRSTLPQTADQDLRTILKAGVGSALSADDELSKRLESRSSISRALAHVEQLKYDEPAKLQYCELKELFRAAEKASQSSSSYKVLRSF